MKIKFVIIHSKKVFNQKITHINQDPKTKFQKAPLEKYKKLWPPKKAFSKV